MSIQVTCDHCDKLYRVRDERAGSTIKCKDCGNRIEVPFDDDEYGYQPAPRRPKASVVSPKFVSFSGPISDFRC